MFGDWKHKAMTLGESRTVWLVTWHRPDSMWFEKVLGSEDEARDLAEKLDDVGWDVRLFRVVADLADVFDRFSRAGAVRPRGAR